MSLLATILAQDEAAAAGLGAVAKLITALGRGLALGSIYALLALSFVLIFKATQAVNFAQGAIALVGTWFLTMVLVDWEIPVRWLGDDLARNRYLVWIPALIVAVALSVLLGLVIERLMIRPMIGKPLFAIAVLTLGLEAVLRTVGNDALIGQQRGLRIPWGRTGFEMEGAFIYWTYVAAIVTAAAAFVVTFLFFRTRTGIAMRAVAFDQEASMAQGIRVGRVFAIAWGAGAALSVLAAIIFSMSGFTSGVAEIGLSSLAFRALPVVILGGLDSIPGAIVGGLVIGVLQNLASAYLDPCVGGGLKNVAPFIILVLILMVKPYGLFGREEIERV